MQHFAAHDSEQQGSLSGPDPDPNKPAIHINRNRKGEKVKGTATILTFLLKLRLLANFQIRVPFLLAQHCFFLSTQKKKKKILAVQKEESDGELALDSARSSFSLAVKGNDFESILIIKSVF